MALRLGAKGDSVRTERFDGGLVVDYAADGKAMGIEITSPTMFEYSQVSQLLKRLGYSNVSRDEFAPLKLAA